MAEVTDRDVDDILRAAEKRLAQGSGTTSVVVDKRPEDTAQVPATAVVASTEKLSVRQPQISKTAPKDDAGSDWFNLPKTDLTPELKRDWQILRMRNILDPKQQRKALRADPPKYSQVGEIVAGPTDFFSGRLTRKERKQNLLQEALVESSDTKMRSKYAGIQKAKTSGKKAFYKKVVSQRRKNKG